MYFLFVTLVTLIGIVVALSLNLLWNPPEEESVGIQFGDEICISGIGMVRGMPYPDTMILCGELKPEPVKKVEGETDL